MTNMTTKAPKTPSNPDDLTFYAELNWEKQSAAAENKSFIIRLLVPGLA